MISDFRDFLMRLGLSLPDFVLLTERLRSSPVWPGVLVDVTVRAGEVSATAPHGLTRAHRGAAVVLAETAVPVFVRAATDPAHVTVYLAAPEPIDAPYRLWVF